MNDQPYIVLTRCPICGGEQLEPVRARSDGIMTLQCAHCRMGFVERYPIDLAAYYEDSYYAGTDPATHQGYAEYNLVAAHSLTWVAQLVRLLRPSGRVLDVGCANGYLLKLLGSSYECYGIEVNTEMAQACRKAGFTIIGTDVTAPEVVADQRGSFDVIIAIAVLEHLADMRAALVNIHDLLADGGVFIAEVPLISDSVDNQVWYESSLEHIYYPTVEGLTYLMGEVFGRASGGHEVHVRGYGATYVLVAGKNSTTHETLVAQFNHLCFTPPDELTRPDVRSFRFLFDVLHSAQVSPELLALLPSVDRALISPEVLHRLGVLWNQTLLLEEARDYHADQTRRWQAVAEQYEEARDYHADQARRWQAVAQECDALRAQMMTTLPPHLLQQLGLLSPASAPQAPAVVRVADPTVAAQGRGVSIIITCYNLGMFLNEALAGALAQTYPDVEVIIIDDGSTDPATITVLDKLPPHPRLRMLRTSNQGVSRARNYAISQACGTYILPLDADDRILPNYLARAVEILDLRPEVGFVGCHYRTFGIRETEYRPTAYRLPDLLVENVVPVASVYRRECWERAGGYCQEINQMEDWDLWLSLLDLGYEAVVLPEIYFEYRVRSNSNLSLARDPEAYQRIMSVLYRRHKALFDGYAQEVLLGKDRQFATLHAHTLWLEQQALSWERTAHEHIALLRIAKKSAALPQRLLIWWRYQTGRVRRVWTEQSDLPSQVRVLGSRVWRVVCRRVVALVRR
jgi:glycosyltransferase involved in cell wall biosynthesis/SAM-dependent methyltransferase